MYGVLLSLPQQSLGRIGIIPCGGRFLSTGMMSACPAYLGLVVFDVGLAAAKDAAAAEMEGQRSAVLLRSDLLIFCPENFTFSVRIKPPPVAEAAACAADAENLRSIVVRFSDAGSSPFYVRLGYVRSNATGRQVDRDVYAGARRRSSTPAQNASQTGDRVTDFTDGNILIAIAITGALFIVVYVGQNSARATTHEAGTLLSRCYSSNGGKEGRPLYLPCFYATVKGDIANCSMSVPCLYLSLEQYSLKEYFHYGCAALRVASDSER